jgi:hypothetical protein
VHLAALGPQCGAAGGLDAGDTSDEQPYGGAAAADKLEEMAQLM